MMQLSGNTYGDWLDSIDKAEQAFNDLQEAYQLLADAENTEALEESKAITIERTQNGTAATLAGKIAKSHERYQQAHTARRAAEGYLKAMQGRANLYANLEAHLHKEHTQAMNGEVGR